MAASLPAKLFKYQSYTTRTLDNLKDRKIWFSRPEAFNDPFELAASIKADRMTDADWKALIDAYIRETGMPGGDGLGVYGSPREPTELYKSDFAKIARQRFGSMLRHLFESGVACFSETGDNVLMWSHYADGHRGFCLEFDTTYAPFQGANEVVYSDDLPDLSVADLVLNRYPNFGATPILTTKAAHWCYEQEWRICGELSNCGFTFKPEALTGIYFGCEMPYAHRSIIALILAGSSTQLHEMTRSTTQFKLESRSIECDEYSYSKVSPIILHV